MAIFSSPEATQTISAPPLPEVSAITPRIIFSGPDCSSITVTLENSVVYKNSQNEQITRRMQKIYFVDSANIQTINVEVKLELSTNGQITQPLITVFKLNVDPHLRNGSSIGNRPNPRFFRGSSAQPVPEASETYYETYGLPLRRNIFPDRSYAITRDPPTDHLVQNFILVEFNDNTSAWSYLTLSSLLSDLLQNCPSFFLKLYIVGNHQITDIETTTDERGVKFQFTPTGFAPTDPANLEARWDQFLMARAASMRKTIFGNRNLQILTYPAIKISPNPSGPGKTVLSQDWNVLASLFQNPDGSADIVQLTNLKLEKGAFGAGSIFLWIILSLQDTEVNFQTNSADVYPASGPDLTNLSKNNLERINKLRRDLSFLVPGSTNNDFTTNLTDVRLQVEGYTDTVASTQSNQTLSEQRASSVIAELVNPTRPLPDGVTSGIDVNKFNPTTGIGYGETRLSIPTPNPWNEPRNRRVLIRVGSAVCQP